MATGSGGIRSKGKQVMWRHFMFFLPFLMRERERERDCFGDSDIYIYILGWDRQNLGVSNGWVWTGNKWIGFLKTGKITFYHPYLSSLVNLPLELPKCMIYPPITLNCTTVTSYYQNRVKMEGKVKHVTRT